MVRVSADRAALRAAAPITTYYVSGLFDPPSTSLTYRGRPVALWCAGCVGEQAGRLEAPGAPSSHQSLLQARVQSEHSDISLSKASPPGVPG